MPEEVAGGTPALDWVVMLSVVLSAVQIAHIVDKD
jgi:hypothetical protein